VLVYLGIQPGIAISGKQSELDVLTPAHAAGTAEVAVVTPGAAAPRVMRPATSTSDPRRKEKPARFPP
jgi:hypothetical protein